MSVVKAITGAPVQFFEPSINGGEPIAAIIVNAKTDTVADLVIFMSHNNSASRANVDYNGHERWWRPLPETF